MYVSRLKTNARKSTHSGKGRQAMTSVQDRRLQEATGFSYVHLDGGSPSNNSSDRSIWDTKFPKPEPVPATYFDDVICLTPKPVVTFKPLPKNALKGRFASLKGKSELDRNIFSALGKPINPARNTDSRSSTASALQSTHATKQSRPSRSFPSLYVHSKRKTDFVFKKPTAPPPVSRMHLSGSTPTLPQLNPAQQQYASNSTSAYSKPGHAQNRRRGCQPNAASAPARLTSLSTRTRTGIKTKQQQCSSSSSKALKSGRISRNGNRSEEYLYDTDNDMLRTMELLDSIEPLPHVPSRSMKATTCTSGVKVSPSKSTSVSVQSKRAYNFQAASSPPWSPTSNKKPVKNIHTKSTGKLSSMRGAPALQVTRNKLPLNNSSYSNSPPSLVKSAPIIDLCDSPTTQKSTKARQVNHKCKIPGGVHAKAQSNRNVASTKGGSSQYFNNARKSCSSSASKNNVSLGRSFKQKSTTADIVVNRKAYPKGVSAKTGQSGKTGTKGSPSDKGSTLNQSRQVIVPANRLKFWLSPLILEEEDSKEFDEIDGWLFASFTTRSGLESYLKTRPEEQLIKEKQACTTTTSPLKVNPHVDKEPHTCRTLAEQQKCCQQQIKQYEHQLIADIRSKNSHEILNPILCRHGASIRKLMANNAKSVNLRAVYGIRFMKKQYRRSKKAQLMKQEQALAKVTNINKVPAKRRQKKVSDVAPSASSDELSKKHSEYEEQKVQQLSLSESIPFKPFEKEVISSKSAFVSDALEKYLEDEEKQLSSIQTPSMHPLLQNKASSVTFKMPSKQSSYFKTLDMALKERQMARKRPKVPTVAQTAEKLAWSLKHSSGTNKRLIQEPSSKETHSSNHVAQKLTSKTNEVNQVSKELPNVEANIIQSPSVKAPSKPSENREEYLKEKRRFLGEKLENLQLQLKTTTALQKRSPDKGRSQTSWTTKFKIVNNRLIQQLKSPARKAHLVKASQVNTTSNKQSKSKEDFHANDLLSSSTSTDSKNEQGRSNNKSSEKSQKKSKGPNEFVRIGQQECRKSFCRLGCVCESINLNIPVEKLTKHCRKTSCMFECICQRASENVRILRNRKRPTIFQESSMLFYGGVGMFSNNNAIINSISENQAASKTIQPKTDGTCARLLVYKSKKFLLNDTKKHQTPNPQQEVPNTLTTNSTLEGTRTYSTGSSVFGSLRCQQDNAAISKSVTSVPQNLKHVVAKSGVHPQTISSMTDKKSSETVYVPSVLYTPIQVSNPKKPGSVILYAPVNQLPCMKNTVKERQPLQQLAKDKAAHLTSVASSNGIFSLVLENSGKPVAVVTPSTAGPKLSSIAPSNVTCPDQKQCPESKTAAVTVTNVSSAKGDPTVNTFQAIAKATIPSAKFIAQEASNSPKANGKLSTDFEPDFVLPVYFNQSSKSNEGSTIVHCATDTYSSGASADVLKQDNCDPIKSSEDSSTGPSLLSQNSTTSSTKSDFEKCFTEKKACETVNDESSNYTKKVITAVVSKVESPRGTPNVSPSAGSLSSHGIPPNTSDTTNQSPDFSNSQRAPSLVIPSTIVANLTKILDPADKSLPSKITTKMPDVQNQEDSNPTKSKESNSVTYPTISTNASLPSKGDAIEVAAFSYTQKSGVTTNDGNKANLMNTKVYLPGTSMSAIGNTTASSSARSSLLIEIQSECNWNDNKNEILSTIAKHTTTSEGSGGSVRIGKFLVEILGKNKEKANSKSISMGSVKQGTGVSTRTFEFSSHVEAKSKPTLSAPQLKTNAQDPNKPQLSISTASTQAAPTVQPVINSKSYSFVPKTTAKKVITLTKAGTLTASPQTGNIPLLTSLPHGSILLSDGTNAAGFLVPLTAIQKNLNSPAPALLNHAMQTNTLKTNPVPIKSASQKPSSLTSDVKSSLPFSNTSKPSVGPVGFDVQPLISKLNTSLITASTTINASQTSQTPEMPSKSESNQGSPASKPIIMASVAAKLDSILSLTAAKKYLQESHGPNNTKDLEVPAALTTLDCNQLSSQVTTTIPGLDLSHQQPQASEGSTSTKPHEDEDKGIFNRMKAFKEQSYINNGSKSVKVEDPDVFVDVESLDEDEPGSNKLADVKPTSATSPPVAPITLKTTSNPNAPWAVSRNAQKSRRKNKHQVRSSYIENDDDQSDAVDVETNFDSKNVSKRPHIALLHGKKGTATSVMTTSSSQNSRGGKRKRKSPVQKKSMMALDEPEFTESYFELTSDEDDNGDDEQGSLKVKRDRPHKVMHLIRERQRRRDQSGLFGGLKLLMLNDKNTRVAKIGILAMAFKEIKNLESQAFEMEVKRTDEMQKNYRKRCKLAKLIGCDIMDFPPPYTERKDVDFEEYSRSQNYLDDMPVSASPSETTSQDSEMNSLDDDEDDDDDDDDDDIIERKDPSSDIQETALDLQQCTKNDNLLDIDRTVSLSSKALSSYKPAFHVGLPKTVPGAGYRPKVIPKSSQEFTRDHSNVGGPVPIALVALPSYEDVKQTRDETIPNYSVNFDQMGNPSPVDNQSETDEVPIDTTDEVISDLFSSDPPAVPLKLTAANNLSSESDDGDDDDDDGVSEHSLKISNETPNSPKINDEEETDQDLTISDKTPHVKTPSVPAIDENEETDLCQRINNETPNVDAQCVHETHEDGQRRDDKTQNLDTPMVPKINGNEESEHRLIICDNTTQNMGIPNVLESYCNSNDGTNENESNGEGEIESPLNDAIPRKDGTAPKIPATISNSDNDLTLQTSTSSSECDPEESTNKDDEESIEPRLGSMVSSEEKSNLPNPSSLSIPEYNHPSKEDDVDKEQSSSMISALDDDDDVELIEGIPSPSKQKTSNKRKASPTESDNPSKSAKNAPSESYTDLDVISIKIKKGGIVRVMCANGEIIPLAVVKACRDGTMQVAVEGDISSEKVEELLSKPEVMEVLEKVADAACVK